MLRLTCLSREVPPSAFARTSFILVSIPAHLPHLGPPRWPPMARPQRRKRQQTDDPPPNPTPFKKAKPSSAHPRPSRTQNQKAPADNPSNDRVPPDKINTGVVSSAGSRKRQAANPLQEERLSKKLKASETVDKPSNFPPEFYDKLSKIWLTPRALRELDRRNGSLTPKPTVRLGSRVPEPARFARGGGPDLSDLRGVCLCSSVVGRYRTNWLV